METRMTHYTNRLALLVSLSILFSSCINTQKVAYFNDVPDALSMTAAPEELQIINPSDILNIHVSSINPEATAIFNPTSPNILNGTSLQFPIGYLVDQEGFIQFPVLGKIKAAGMTKKVFTEMLRNTLLEKRLLVDPVVTVRFLNFRVTVLGEVSRPMVVTVPNERISILEALGMAGDLTIFARRENLLLIREEGGQRIMKRIDLNSKNLFSSPYYYLKNGDILYAEPNKAKVASATNSRQLLPVVLSGLSFVAIIIDRVTR